MQDLVLGAAAAARRLRRNKTLAVLALGGLVALASAPMAGPVWAQSEPTLKPITPEGDGAPAKRKKRRVQEGPGFSAQTRAKERTTDATEASILANIDNQKMILELEDPSNADYPRMVVALADFYWDLSTVYDRLSMAEALEQGIYDAEESGDAGKLATLKAQQESLLAQVGEFQRKTVSEYRRVLREFPRAGDLDEFRYYLGYHLSAMGEREEGLQAFQELIQNHPQSMYVPDALVNIGEYYFDENDYANALKLYQAVEQFPDAPIVSYAIYKQAWSQYNLADYQEALKGLVAVIERANSGQAGAMELKEEATGELVFPYAKVGKPSAAVAFFKRYAPDGYLELSSKLAGLYTEQTEYARSNKLLRSLIKMVRAPKPDATDQQHMVVRFQRQIVENAHKKADKGATVEEVKELIRLVEDVRGTAPKAFMAREEKDISDQILAIATGYHAEYESTKETTTLEKTQLLYDEYLRLFRDGKNVYAITMNNALLMMLTGKYRQAASEFEKVIAMEPSGKYADEAAERAVVAYLKTMQIQNQDVKAEAEDDLARQELDADGQRFVQAVDRWMALIAKQGVNEDTADNVPPARFAAAKVLYNANQFEAAANRFRTFVDAHPGHRFWVDAARHVLSSHNLAHDAESLKAAVFDFEKNSDLMASSLAQDITRIKNEFDYLECFKFEKTEEYLGAAECFATYAKTYPDDSKAPAGVYNAGLNYFRAREVERALETQKRLYENYNEHELAPKALYSIAEIFRETTVYDQAAQFYEIFVANHPDHNLAKKALQYASVFRKTLTDYDAAIRNLDLYLDRYPEAATAPRVHLDIVLIHAAQRKHTHVLKAVRQHLKAYPSEAPALRLRVLALRGKAYDAMNRDKDARKAFQETVDHFGALTDDQIAKLDMPAISAVAEAHYKLGEQTVRRARYVKLKGSPKKMKAAIQKKLMLMTEAKSIYDEVIGYGHPGWTIAAYTQLGRAYRDLAQAVEEAEVPRRLKHLPEAVEEYRTQMAERAAPIREQALKSYRTAVDIAKRDHWFNEFSQRAEKELAELDLQDASVKEFRVRPTYAQPNSGLPAFKEDAK